MLSRRVAHDEPVLVAHDEPVLLELLADVLALDDEMTRGIDLADGGAALAIAILLNNDQPVGAAVAGWVVRVFPISRTGHGR
ncbi:hypothetical protein [Streptomyces sp. NPDC096311]|uniref:hypothetical protein n=1 Tax=Streptomyces sp. NPDC096311 TaxID=3366083 RepID=UPI0037F468A1